MKFAIPSALRLEHDELRNFLVRAAKEKGELGNAARLVARLAEPEEQVLYPAAVLVGEYLKLRLPRVSEAPEPVLAGS